VPFQRRQCLFHSLQGCLSGDSSVAVAAQLFNHLHLLRHDPARLPYALLGFIQVSFRLFILNHSGHLGAGGSDAAMLSAVTLCALSMTSASVRHVS
jgi:hypothetical protein